MTRSVVRPLRVGQRGVSLIELMVGITLGLVLLAAVMYVFVASRKSYDGQEGLARLQESSRFAVDAVVQDLRRAGFLGENADIEFVEGDDSAANEPACDDTTAWGRRVGMSVFGLDDTAAGYGCIDNYLQGDVIVARYAEAPVITTAPAGTRLYIRSSLSESQVMSGNETNTVDDEPRWLRHLAARAYYIAESGRTCNGTAVPSLWAVSLDPDGTPAAPVELVPGIEQLQVQWGVDANGDDEVEAYLPSDDAGLNWGQVVSARVWVLARSECPEGGHTDTFSYLMGNLPVYTPADGYRRQLSVSTVMLRNRIPGIAGGGGGGGG